MGRLETDVIQRLLGIELTRQLLRCFGPEVTRIVTAPRLATGGTPDLPKA